MKRLPALSAFFSILLVMTAPAAEAPNTSQSEQQILAAVREVQNQQVAIAENQAKIEARVAALAEILRIARIYSSRAGGK